MTIRNVVFDIGNVVVRWDPALIVERTFGKERSNQDLVQSIFPGENSWIPLNKGEISAEEAMGRYRDQLGFTERETESLWSHILGSLDLVPGTTDLMKRLSRQGYRLFALSDNVHEIVAYLKAEYAFWPLFEGAVISAEVGLVKPDEQIYRHLLETHKIKAEETIFLDDLPGNVSGAESIGITGIQFETAEQAELDMRRLGLNLA